MKSISQFKNEFKEFLCNEKYKEGEFDDIFVFLIFNNLSDFAYSVFIDITFTDFIYIEYINNDVIINKVSVYDYNTVRNFILYREHVKKVKFLKLNERVLKL